jgi:hypothetical protein
MYMKTASTLPVYMFLLEATAEDTPEAAHQNEPGSRHTILAFVKQDEADRAAPNWAICESVLKVCGWVDVEFKGATLATPEAVKGVQKTPEPAIDQAYQDSFGKGFGVLVFRD